MSIRVVGEDEQRAKREEMAVKLEQLAHDIRRSPGAPKAVICFVFEGTGIVRRYKKVGDDFNVLEGMGVLEYAKAELMSDIGIRVLDPGVPPPKGPAG